MISDNYFCRPVEVTDVDQPDVLAAKTGYRLSTSEIGRILRFKEIRPHHIAQWLHCEDPEFLPKAKAVCDLYLNPPKGAVVVCVDEKPMQSLERRHPTHVAGDGTVRYEHEYKRHGTQALLAAFDIATGKVLGYVLPQRTALALVDFMEALARRYPTEQVHVVWPISMCTTTARTIAGRDSMLATADASTSSTRRSTLHG